ncbi:hypothetical protein LN650_12625 [Klebsiella pneumoniae subsp. pneumoniae]|nr:hypothetical protein [Klebsiella pneumoniae subsp. pneumoniae]
MAANTKEVDAQSMGILCLPAVHFLGEKPASVGKKPASALLPKLASRFALLIK